MKQLLCDDFVKQYQTQWMFDDVSSYPSLSLAADVRETWNK